MTITQTTQIEWLYILLISIIGIIALSILFAIASSVNVDKNDPIFSILMTTTTIVFSLLMILTTVIYASMGNQNIYTSNLLKHELKNDYAYNESDDSSKFKILKTPDEYEFYDEEMLVYLNAEESIQLEIEYSKPKIEKLIKQNFLRDVRIYIIKDNEKYLLPQKYYKEEGLVPLLKKAYDPIEKLEQEKEGKKPFFSFAIKYHNICFLEK